MLYNIKSKVKKDYALNRYYNRFLYFNLHKFLLNAIVQWNKTPLFPRISKHRRKVETHY